MTRLQCAVLALALATATSAYDVGVNRPFGDAPHMPVSLGVAACAALCAQADICVAWVVEVGTNECWIKDTMMPQQAGPGYVSSVKNTTVSPAQIFANWCLPAEVHVP
jgi:hypothetical protein